MDYKNSFDIYKVDMLFLLTERIIYDVVISLVKQQGTLQSIKSPNSQIEYKK